MGAYRRDREASLGFCSGRLSNQRTEISSGEEVAQRGTGVMIDPIEGAVAQVIVMAIATTGDDRSSETEDLRRMIVTMICSEDRIKK